MDAFQPSGRRLVGCRIEKRGVTFGFLIGGVSSFELRANLFQKHPANPNAQGNLQTVGGILYGLVLLFAEAEEYHLGAFDRHAGHVDKCTRTIVDLSMPQKVLVIGWRLRAAKRPYSGRLSLKNLPIGFR